MQGLQGRVEILLTASCYSNRDKLRHDGPLGSNADFNNFNFCLKAEIEQVQTRATSFIAGKGQIELAPLIFVITFLIGLLSCGIVYLTTLS